MLTPHTRRAQAGQDEPLIDQLVEGVKPVLISHYPLLTSVLYGRLPLVSSCHHRSSAELDKICTYSYVVIKGLSAASEAHNWLYKRKLNGKYEVLSGVRRHLPYLFYRSSRLIAPSCSANSSSELLALRPNCPETLARRYGTARRTSQTRCGSKLASTKSHSLKRPSPLPRRPRREDPLSTSSLRSLRRLRVPRPDPLKAKSPVSVRARIQWLVKIKTRISSVKSSSSARDEIEQLYAGLDDERQILHAENVYNEGLVAMRDFLRERIGVTEPDREAAAANELFDQAS